MKTTNFKRIISIFALITLLMSFMSFAVSAITPTEAKESVVAVIGAGNKQGTGFAIGKVGKPVQYIVTNYHVVENYTTATVAFDLASGQSVLASVHVADPQKDIAVLKLPQPTEQRKPLVICPMKYVDYDDSFAALGYPGNIATDWPQYSTNDITITKGGIKRDARINGQDTYILDIQITYGNSGGPLVNSKGEVVGINSFMLNEDNYAIAIDELLSIIHDDIDSGKILVSMHGDINISWIIIAGIAVLIIIIVLVIVLVTRKGGDNGEAAVAAGPEFTGGYDAPAGNPTVGAAPAPMQTTGVTQALSAKLIAVGGTLNGKRYSFNDCVKIGRDPSKCSITYPVNTNGISSAHCEVSFNGSVCYVKDLGSSYGTFTLDGKKIAPNTAHPLQNGEKFYLASPENTFEVRF